MKQRMLYGLAGMACLMMAGCATPQDRADRTASRVERRSDQHIDRQVDQGVDKFFDRVFR